MGHEACPALHESTGIGAASHPTVSIWNKHLCGLFGGGKETAKRRGDFTCPLCGEAISAGELRAHAAKDDQRFKHGLMIARIKQDHPEWVEADGACPKCVEYYRQLVATSEKIQPRQYPDRDVGVPKWAKH
jgi:predicted RNA-binding Zn-ribbon protein involved in translation (DUF1610 family)